MSLDKSERCRDIIGCIGVDDIFPLITYRSSACASMPSLSPHSCGGEIDPFLPLSGALLAPEGSQKSTATENNEDTIIIPRDWLLERMAVHFTSSTSSMRLINDTSDRFTLLSPRVPPRERTDKHQQQPQPQEQYQHYEHHIGGL